MAIHNYIGRPSVSTCVQWDGTNNDELTAYVASFPYDRPPAPTLTWVDNVPTLTNEGISTELSVGDWLVFGTFQPESNADFVAHAQLTNADIVYDVSDYTA